ncbi:hypothetical protein [Arcicella aurantiaca]|nr:hypothetical protein [Arcicella aurantiaca]
MPRSYGTQKMVIFFFGGLKPTATKSVKPTAFLFYKFVYKP